MCDRLRSKRFHVIVLCLGDHDITSIVDSERKKDIEAACGQAIKLSTPLAPIMFSMPLGRVGLDEQAFPVRKYRQMVQQVCENKDLRICYAYHRMRLKQAGTPQPRMTTKSGNELSKAG